MLRSKFVSFANGWMLDSFSEIPLLNDDWLPDLMVCVMVNVLGDRMDDDVSVGDLLFEGES